MRRNIVCTKSTKNIIIYVCFLANIIICVVGLPCSTHAHTRMHNATFEPLRFRMQCVRKSIKYACAFGSLAGSRCRWLPYGRPIRSRSSRRCDVTHTIRATTTLLRPRRGPFTMYAIPRRCAAAESHAHPRAANYRPKVRARRTISRILSADI